MELFSSVVRPLESVSMAFELGGRKGGEGMQPAALVLEKRRFAFRATVFQDIGAD